ncbi:outer membrane protein assembly factor BamA [Geobacter sp. OR-1]|uniref:BamA/TamA family outer membrane protein n=1 Tax=Geobacter sp. OR-1 TaxID=1266765 RepID=UPI00054257C7|nr:BamA/TamA family outer membrane protein [Geobacter sp. OR-1]GAM08710.1 outer membrane protein assembly factor BamA [Geobacter sp. OR-1]
MKFFRLTIALLSLTASACTSIVPKEQLPFPLTNSDSPQQVKVVSIPLPVIASSPNEGITGGALTAFLIHNAKDEINTLVAPQVNYNENFGVTTSLYGAFYPTPTRNWEANLSQSTNINNDYELRITDKSFLDGKLELNAFGFHLTDGSSRFFGFQSDSSKDNETNYANRETGFTFSASYNFWRHVSFFAGERLRVVTIHKGAVKGVPFLLDVFNPAEVPGSDGFTAHAQRFGLSYSTLDSMIAPTFGGYARVSVEISAENLGSSANYQHYEAEAKGFLPLDGTRYITAFRVAYNQTLGNAVPFLERSILGGESTLRGYGRNRFIDSSYFLCNLEERIRLFRWEIFDVTADWELAPFVDLGAVIEKLDKANSRNFEFNPGVGFRAVVRPNIVGRVDLGFGKDGPAVFVGLGHPF